MSDLPLNAFWSSHPFLQEGKIPVAIYSDAVELSRAGKGMYVITVSDLRHGRQAERVAVFVAHKDILDGKSRGAGGGAAFSERAGGHVAIQPPADAFFFFLARKIRYVRRRCLEDHRGGLK